MITKEVKFILGLLNDMGREEKISLFSKSSLTDREIDILTLRYVYGITIKEAAEKIGLEYETFCKAQQKATKRLYSYIMGNI